MRLVVLPAYRLGRVQGRLSSDVGLSDEQSRAVMQVIEDELEVGARRIGSVCPVESCGLIVDDHRRESPGGVNVRMWQECKVHGPVTERALALAIAFAPSTSRVGR